MSFICVALVMPVVIIETGGLVGGPVDKGRGDPGWTKEIVFFKLLVLTIILESETTAKSELVNQILPIIVFHHCKLLVKVSWPDRTLKKLYQFV